MDLFHNPFYILNATTHDDRRRITELADDRSLLLEADMCLAARNDLITPRKRLAAEVAWLPGAGPKRAEEVLALIANMPDIEILPPTARANVLSAVLAHSPQQESEDIAEMIIELAQAFEDIDPQKLTALINEDRIVSGFPKITDISVVESEIKERRWHYRKVIKSTVGNLDLREYVKAVTIVVDSATESGQGDCPILVADLVDSYEVNVQKHLDAKGEIILSLADRLKASVGAGSPDSVLGPLMINLAYVVKSWNSIAQPIQVCAKSRGIDHDASLRVAGVIRKLAIDIVNKNGVIDYPQQLTNLLKETFAEVELIAERTEEDAKTLEKMAKQGGVSLEERRNKITFETKVGWFIFKMRLSISPDGIEWNGRLRALDSITRISWGGTCMRYPGLIGTKEIVEYFISYGNDNYKDTIKLTNKSTFIDFTDRLWMAVGVRLLQEHLEGLRMGNTYRFGSVILHDTGIEFVRGSLLVMEESVFCRWAELKIFNEPGYFCIVKTRGENVGAFLSYGEDNIHILEIAIRTFLKQGGIRLSSLLD